MITPVSFSSNYTVKTKRHNFDNQKKFRQFVDFSDSVVMRNDNCSQIIKYKTEEKFPYYFQGYTVLSVPDEMDEMIQGYLDFHGIKYKKS